MSDFFGILLLAVPLFYVIVVIGFVRWYVATQTAQMSATVAWSLRIAVISIIIVAMGLATIFTFFGAFGPGAWIQCGALPFSICAISYYAIRAKRVPRKSKNDQHPKRWLSHFGAVICISVVSLSPILGSIVVGSVFQLINHNRAQGLINAIDAYHADSGEYPDSIDLLMPDYITDVPEPFATFTIPNVDGYTGFQYQECRDGNHIVWYNPPRGGFPVRYHFESGHWSSISVFDGVCSFLPDS